MKISGACVLLLVAGSLALAAADASATGDSMAASRRLLAPTIGGKGQTTTDKSESTEYVEVIEYQNKLVTEKETKFVPKLTTDTIRIKTPRIIMQHETVEVPRVTYRTETVMQTKAITKPIVTMEPHIVHKPNLVLNAGKGKGHMPKLDAHIEEKQSVVMTPRYSTTTEFVKVPVHVNIPVTTMENVTVSKPKLVMEEQLITTPRVVLDKIVVDKLVNKKEPVKVMKPVRKITYSTMPTSTINLHKDLPDISSLADTNTVNTLTKLSSSATRESMGSFGSISTGGMPAGGLGMLGSIWGVPGHLPPAIDLPVPPSTDDAAPAAAAAANANAAAGAATAAPTAAAPAAAAPAAAAPAAAAPAAGATAAAPAAGAAATGDEAASEEIVSDDGGDVPAAASH